MSKKALQTLEGTPAPLESKVHYIQKTIGNDTWLVMAQSQVELEDEWASLYYTAQNQSNIFLLPPFEPLVLLELVQTNNTLNQCIEAMEVNVDGTGFDIVPFDKNTEIDPDEEARAYAFLDQPYPGESLVSIRRKLRREIESVGYGYLEVLRNMKGDIVAFRNIQTHNVRMVKLDEPVLIQTTVNRNGEDVDLEMWVRERRFAQRVALKTLVYYREFGTTRQVDRNNGKWETESTQIEWQNRGTELLMFGVNPDVRTPYSLPRWINQLPSVVGSRKAEEQNLQFLDSGGMPPAIIFVQGGTLAKDTSDQLKAYLSGQNKNKYRAVVVEAQSASGSLDSAGNVKVTVERFGSAKANDAMYLQYDERTEKHVRAGFRLPPLFLGNPEEYSYATAQTSYLVAEEQVFSPERDEFDAIFNATIMKELGFKTIKFASKPLTLKDIATQIEALKIAKDMTKRESMIETINSLTDLNLELDDNLQPDSVAAQYAPPTPITDASGNQLQQLKSGRTLPTPASPAPSTAQEPAKENVSDNNGVSSGNQEGANSELGNSAKVVPGTSGLAEEQEAAKNLENGSPNNAPGNNQKQAIAEEKQAKAKKQAIELIELAQNYVKAKGLVQKSDVNEDLAQSIKNEADLLDARDRRAFNRLVATYAYGTSSDDLETLAGRL
jgi:PBSX family phage portal protein